MFVVVVEAARMALATLWHPGARLPAEQEDSFFIHHGALAARTSSCVAHGRRRLDFPGAWSASRHYWGQRADLQPALLWW